MKTAISIGTGILGIVGAFLASYGYAHESHPPYLTGALICYSFAFLGRSDWFK